MTMENLLISACFLGVSCRYDGVSKPLPPQILENLKAKYHLIPVCAEIFGGLSTPREPAERVGEKVLTQSGKDVTAAYQKGAAEVLRLANFFDCRKALLKEKSPSCGAGLIHDGSFSGGLRPGNGVTAALLMENGIAVFGESDIEKL